MTATVRHPVGYGVAIGLLATGAGLGVAELVVGLVEGSASPVVPVGQEFIDVVPAGLKDWAIRTFGTSDKVVLVGGALIVLCVVGAIVGVLAVRGRWTAAIATTVGVGVVGALAVFARPAPSVGDFAPTVMGTVTSIGVLLWFRRRVLLPPAQDRGPTMGVDRRAFVTSAVGIVALGAMAGGLGRLLQRRFSISEERAALALPTAADVPPPLPSDADLGVDGVDPFLTPNIDFYRIDTALVVPQVSAASWRLRIHGMVDHELELTFADLLAHEQVDRYITLSCVSNSVGGDLVGNARWQGVLLADVLAEAGVAAGAEQLVSRSVDGWTCGTPVAAVLDGRDAMLAIAMNGEPLPASHGYPVRMVVPGLYGYVSATKWVTEMQLTTWDAFDAYWVPRGWAKEAPVKTMTRIDTPRGTRPAGRIDIGGLAWAVHRGISAVEVRIDGGDWQRAELGGVPSDDTWRQWVLRWDAEPGGHEIEARAFDGAGEVQLADPAPPAPDGAQGYHRIAITVE